MNALQTFIASKPMGFLKVSSNDILELIALDRLCPVLVRCGGCRVTCAAQDVAHLSRCINAGGDYVRDISFPVGSQERAAKWQPDCPVTPIEMLFASFLEHPSPAAVHARRIGDYAPYFNESDCGGVFNGNIVSSDADPGL